MSEQDDWQIDTADYRLAPSGEGSQAAQWADKPHRLVYDLCGEIDRLRARVAELEAFARDCRDNWDCDEDAHRYRTTCRACDAAKVLEDTAKGG